jgi:hypothetical protein
MRSFGLFLKAVARHWWFLMATVVFAVLRFVPVFRSKPIPREVYWLGMLISLFLALFLAWRDEYRRAEALKGEVDGPSFIGHVYQFNIHPRTGITPPKMLQEALDIFAESRGQPKTEYKADCDVFVEACVVNKVLAVGTVLEYEIEVERDGQCLKLRSEPGFLGWN